MEFEEVSEGNYNRGLESYFCGGGEVEAIGFSDWQW